MDRWKKDLIGAATTSPAFPSRDRERHRRVLEHLASHSSRHDREVRSERYLEEEFLLDGATARVFLQRLERGLEHYFASDEGQRHVHRIEILRGKGVAPEDRYTVRFPLNRTALARIFWQPHLDERYRTFLAYGIPLFIRNTEQTIFTRYVDVNSQADEKLKSRMGETDEVCWPFVTHGDLQATIECLRWLADRDVRVQFAAFNASDQLHALEKATRDDANVIAVGSTRVNGILDEYQRLELLRTKGNARRFLPFRVRTYDVIEIDDREELVGRPFEEHRKGGTSIVPVVITRRLGAKRNSVTLIASNHGRAVHRVAELLTHDDELHDLFQDPRLQAWLPELPAQFQILLCVTVLAHEAMAGTFTVEDVWAGE